MQADSQQRSYIFRVASDRLRRLLVALCLSIPVIAALACTNDREMTERHHQALQEEDEME